MQNSDIIRNGIRFALLILLQVLLCNQINFLGYINPFIYPLFILVYPLTGNKALLIFLSFLLGLTIDIFGDSGGIHAAACVFIAWIRPIALKYSFGVSYEYNTIDIAKANISRQITYIATMVLFHHLILFSLEIFSVAHILLILKYTLFTSIFSGIMIHGSILLFSRTAQ